MIIDYLPDCFKSFQGESDGHEDGAAENDVVDGVEEVAECVRVKRRRPEVTPVRFDHAKHDELRKEIFHDKVLFKIDNFDNTN